MLKTIIKEEVDVSEYDEEDSILFQSPSSHQTQHNSHHVPMGIENWAALRETAEFLIKKEPHENYSGTEYCDELEPLNIDSNYVFSDNLLLEAETKNHVEYAVYRGHWKDHSVDSLQRSHFSGSGYDESQQIVDTPHLRKYSLKLEPVDEELNAEIRNSDLFYNDDKGRIIQPFTSYFKREPDAPAIFDGTQNFQKKAKLKKERVEKDRKLLGQKINIAKVHKCRICGNGYRSHANLTMHMQRHKEPAKTKVLKCNSCNREYSRKDHLINHLKLHIGDTPFSCTICFKKFVSRLNFLNHMKMHVKREDKKTQKQLQKEGEVKIRLKEEIETQKQLKTNPKVKRSLKGGRKTDTQGQISTRIDLKDKRIKTHSQLNFKGELKESSKGERLKKTQGSLPTRAKMREGPIDTQKQLEIKEKIFQCNTCYRNFTRKELLIKHLMIHIRDTSYSCTICLQVYGSKPTLVMHMKSHSCGTRKKDSTENGKTKSKFSCEICAKSCKGRSYLDAHRKSHITVKTPLNSYECVICGNLYKHKGHLKCHVSKVH